MAVWVWPFGNWPFEYSRFLAITFVVAYLSENFIHVSIDLEVLHLFTIGLI